MFPSITGLFCLIGASINREKVDDDLRDTPKRMVNMYFCLLFFAALKAITSGVFFILDFVGIGGATTSSPE